MKQTAVEWLVEEFKEKLTGNNLPNSVLDIIKQAKAMEKEQIGNAYVYGSAYGINLENGLSPNNYYNETFKSE